MVVLALGLSLFAAGTATSCSSEAKSTQLTVYAAASLKGPFTEIGRQFETAHPGTSVVFNFAGSSDLVAQVREGAPADVLATADTATMRQVTDDGRAAAATVPFATNSMTIAVPIGNPAGIERFADIGDDTVQVVVCAPQVPCGAATERVERKTGVTLRPVSEEQAVTGVLDKVAAGEADAGVVYVTDVRGAADRVTGVPIPRGDNTVTTYPIVTLMGSTAPDLAREFQAVVVSAEGEQVLADAGFGPS